MFTDHKPLVATFYSRSDQIVLRRACQLSFISEFTNDVAHISGEDNVVPDALSRIKINHFFFSQTDIDYAPIAETQKYDETLQSFLNGSAPTSLKREEVPLENGVSRIVCIRVNLFLN